MRNPLVMLGLGPLWALILEPRLVPSWARARFGRKILATDVVLVGAARRTVRAVRLARCRARPVARGDARGCGGHLALLRATPVRGRLLGARAGLELRGLRAARQFVPADAEAAAVLHRQHRPAPRASPQRPHPQLQPAARPRREPGVPHRPRARPLGAVLAMRLKLYDEQRGRLVGFAEATNAQRQVVRRSL